MMMNNNGTRVIESHEATVKTMTVAIKAMTIGKRQVTLSVFRQLLMEQVIDPATGQFRGVPWGKVNYRWGYCDQKGQDHLHVVWQKGDELRRACVDPHAEAASEAASLLDSYRRLQGSARDLAVYTLGLKQRAEVRDGGDGRLHSYLGPWQVYDSQFYGAQNRDRDRELVEWWRVADKTLAGPSLYAGISDQEAAARRAKFTAARGEVEYMIGACTDALEEEDLGPFRENAITADAWAAHRVLEDRIRKVKSDWQARYKELVALDHLFIAV
jgi:hypothetical protein